MERYENLRVLETNTKFIQELADEFEKIKIELEVAYEQTLNNKALLEETNAKLYRAQDELNNSEYSFLQQEIKRLKNILTEKEEKIKQY